VRCRYCCGEVRVHTTRPYNHERDIVRYRKCQRCKRQLRTIELELTPLVSDSLMLIGKKLPA